MKNVPLITAKERRIRPSPRGTARPGDGLTGSLADARGKRHSTGREVLKSCFNLPWLAGAVLCTVSLLTLTHLPQDPTPAALRDGPFHIDKIEHVLAYGSIGALYILALRRRERGLVVPVLAVVATLSLLDELTQPLVGRTASLWDYFADLIGVAISSLACLAQRRF